jgi:hypothetical protein
MTRRERIMSLAMGAVVATFGLYVIVKWVVLTPFTNVDKQIESEMVRGENLAAQLHKLSDAPQEWSAIVGRTFSDDPQEAQRRFREDMHQLASTLLHNAKVSPGTLIKYKDGSTGAPVTISAEGTLNEVVSFLRAFYQREYLARLDKVQISAEQTVINDVNSASRQGRTTPTPRRGRGGGPTVTPAAGAPGGAGPNGPQLKVVVNAVTLVLAPAPGVPVKFIPDGPVEEHPKGRNLQELDEYNAIFAHNLFTPFQPKPVAATQSTVEVATTQKIEPHIEAPPPPPVVYTSVVRAMTALHGELIALVYDDAKPTEEPRQVRLDEAFDDGKLVLIHPEGVVVRVEKDGQRTDCFYPFGESAKSRVKLTREAQPEVFEALEREFVSSTS